MTILHSLLHFAPRSPILSKVAAISLATGSADNDTGRNDWQALAAREGLSDADIQQLDRDCVLITNRAYKQIFEAYGMGNGALPVFVTSDSLLNAYHVLYEESILQLEQANCRVLPEILWFVMEGLDDAAAEAKKPVECVTAAKQRAMIVLGTALKLLDDDFRVTDETAMGIIDEEVTRIVEAKAAMKPAWLGPSERDFMWLDYSRYKVRGFYTRNEALTRHFRALSWLQSIPFRVSHDDELLAILMLGRCIAPDGSESDHGRYERYCRFFRVYAEFLGVGDDWDLVTAAEMLAGGLDVDLDTIRARLIARAEDGPQINDQVRFLPDDPNMVAEPNFRIVSAYRLPEAVLFQRTTDIRQFEMRFFPDGLEVCVALGSAFARERLDSVDKAKVLATIDANEALFEGSSLYFDYLRVIETLVDAPEPGAPAFMATEPWQAKSCGTALAGWAQARHTWVLQAKVVAGGLAGFWGEQGGFVEPVPEFFRRMAHLAARTRDLLATAGVFDNKYPNLRQFLGNIIDLLEQSKTRRQFWQAFKIHRHEPARGEDILRELLSDGVSAEDWTGSLAQRLRHIADDLSKGIVDSAVRWEAVKSDVDIEAHWSSLKQMSLRLESIARKQLAGVRLNKEEVAFFVGFPDRLATLMLYDDCAGGSDARDDAVRIADVYSEPQTGCNLQVGIGRARAIYVLYPWRERTVLCRGAVIPYHEFRDGERLTDAEWKARLDSDARPDVPTWLRCILSETGLSSPDFSTSDGR